MLIICAKLVPSVSQAKAYAQTVVDSSKARKLQAIGARLTFEGVFAENANEVADKVMGELYELLSSQNKKQLQSIDSVGLQFLEDYKSEDKNSENPSQTYLNIIEFYVKGPSQAGEL